MREQDMAIKNLIYKVRTGSKMYGTNTEDADDDFNGIFIPTKDYVIGLYRCEQVILNEKTNNKQVDYTIYSLPKFFKLAQENNPNIVELFFIPPHNILTPRNKYIDMIRENYPLFISKKVYHTFKGYAYSQRLKMENKVRDNITGKRLALWEKYGWDVKFGSHLIRLLLEGLEILIEGRLNFPLSQNCLVRDIKLGKYSMEEVIEKAGEIEKLVDQAYVTSSLPHSPDIEGINKLQIEILEQYWEDNQIRE